MAICYLLEKASLPPFLPFLYPGDRVRAQKGELFVLGVTTREEPRGEVAAGALAFDLDGDTAIIRSISVSPEFQNCGMAGRLLRELKTVLPAMDGFFIDLSLTEDHPVFAQLDHILLREGFTVEQSGEYAVYRLGDFLESPMLKRGLDVPSSSFVTLDQVPGVALRSLAFQAQKSGRLGGPLEWNSFDPKLTILGRDGDNEFKAAVCISKNQRGVCVEWIYLTDRNQSLLLIGAMVRALKAATEIYGAEGVCTAALVDSASQKIIRSLSGKDGTTNPIRLYTLDLLETPATD